MPSIRHGEDSVFEAFCRQAGLVQRVVRSDDLQEGTRAFAEKRKPRWTGPLAAPPLARRGVYVQAALMEILLVEDSPEVSLITVEYLTELGHTVVAVSDAELAIDQVSQRAFDAVMTDVSLPGMSGIDLAKELIRQYPRLPVVIASGYGGLNVEFLVGQGQLNVHILPKPYDMTMLEKTLAKATSFAQA
jgi:CheY-like chemotaxis protein